MNNLMGDETASKIHTAGIAVSELVAHFRERCKMCGHHRIMHDAGGYCEGVMNKPCNSGCESFGPE